MAYTILIFLMLTENIYEISADSRVKTQQQIVARLFEDYSPVVKPRLNLSQPVDINITLHFTSLREIDERLQTMTFIGWMELSWIDEFLILKDGVKSVQLPKSAIWYPDVALYNSIDDPLRISDGEHIVLLEDGRVVWYPGRQYSVICLIDIRRFPFDVQKCQIRLGSWQTPVWVQRIVDTGDSLSDLGYEENGEWEIIDKITKPEYNSDFRISYVTYEIHFRRLCLYPVINTLLPVILLSFLNTLVFLLPANSGEKMTVCISVLLSFTVFLTVFNDMMPKISTTISYLSIYLCVQLAMSGLAVMESIYIWRINYREKTETTGYKQNSTLVPNPAEGIEFHKQDSWVGEDSLGRQLDCSSNPSGCIINNNMDDERALSKRLSIPSFKQTYSVTAEGRDHHCKFNSSRLDLMCFWFHLCVNSLSTTILLIMFWI